LKEVMVSVGVLRKHVRLGGGGGGKGGRMPCDRDHKTWMWACAAF
jgi:hypothetical protein